MSMEPKETGTSTKSQAETSPVAPAKTAAKTATKPRATYKIPPNKKWFDKPQEETAQHTLGRWELFDQFETHTHFPLGNIKDVISPKVNTATCIDLTGVDQLTDIFFYVLLKEYGSLPSVTVIRLVGCVHIGDGAVAWLAQLCNNLEEVYLDGCRNVTERSLHYLIQKCSNLKTISIMTTNVGVIGQSIKNIRLTGAPLVYPTKTMISNYQTNEKGYTDVIIDQSNSCHCTYKVLMLTPPEFCLHSLLTKGEVLTPMPLEIHRDYQVEDDIKCNIYQMDETFAMALGSTRSLFIITYNAGEDTPATLFNTMLQFIRKWPGSTFIVLAIGKEYGDFDSSKLREGLSKEISKTINRIDDEIGRWFKNNMATSNNLEQTSMIHLVTLKESLTAMLGNNLSDYVLFSDNIFDFNGKQDRIAELNNLLKRGVKMVDAIFPYYTRLPLELLEKYEKNETYVCAKISEYVKPLRGSLGGELPISGDRGMKAAKYSHMLGAVILTHKQPLAKSEGTNTEGDWLVWKDSEGDNSLRYLDYIKMNSITLEEGGVPYTACIIKASTTSYRNIDMPDRDFYRENKDVSGEDKEKEQTKEEKEKQQERKAKWQKNMNAITTFWNDLASCSMAYREDVCDDREKIILVNDIPATPPMELDFYKANNDNPHALTVQRDFNLAHTISTSAMKQLILWCTDLGNVDVISSTLLIIQDETLEIHLSLNPGCDIITLGVQMMKTDNDMDTLAWQAYHLYALIVEYFLKTNNIYYGNKVLVNGSETSVIPDNEHNSPALIGHKVQKIERKKPAESSTECIVCGMKSSTIDSIWKMERYVRPTFVHPNTAIHTDNVRWLGSVVTIQPSDKEQDNAPFLLLDASNVRSTVNLICLDVEEGGLQFEAKKMSAKKNGPGWVLGFRSTSGIVQSVHTLSDRNRTRREKQHEYAIVLAKGDTFEFGRGGNSPGVKLFRNGTHSANVSLDKHWILHIGEPEHDKPISVILDVSTTCPYPNIDSRSDWVNGNCVEYIGKDDTIHPATIIECVFTATTVNNETIAMMEAAYLEVHTDTSDIRPDEEVPVELLRHVGYYQSLSPNEKSSKTFVTPAGWKDWATFLLENHKTPVPLTAFNTLEMKEEEKTPIDGHLLGLKSETIKALEIMYKKPIGRWPGIWHCGSSIYTSLKWQQRLSDLKTAAKECLLDWDYKNFPLLTTLPPPILLPANIWYMNWKNWFAGRQLYLLCPIEGGIHHIIQNKTVKGLDKISLDPMTDLILVLYLLLSKNHALLYSSHWLELHTSYLLMTNSNQIDVKALVKNRELLLEAIENAGNNLDEAWTKALKVQNMASYEVAQDDALKYICSGHRNALSPHKGLQKFPVIKLPIYRAVISEIDLSGNKIANIEADIFVGMTNLQKLNLSNTILTEVPKSIEKTKMKHLNVAKNKLTTLPDELGECPLEALIISSNKFPAVPDIISKCLHLEILEMANMAFREIPAFIGQLKKLKVINLNANAFTELPSDIINKANPKELYLGGVPWIPDAGFTHDTLIGKDRYEELMQETGLDNLIDEQERTALFKQFDSNNEGTLTQSDVFELNKELRKRFPRLSNTDSRKGGEYFHDLIINICGKDLEVLDLSYQVNTIFPDKFKNKYARDKTIRWPTSITKVILKYCVNLEALSTALFGGLKNLKSLDITGCNNLINPPKEILEKGEKTVIGYLRRLQLGSDKCRKAKIMMIGIGGAGKTSLARSLKGDYVSLGETPEKLTDGISLMKMTHKTGDSFHRNKESIEYTIWDFAGQTIYYNTHQFFMSNRAIYFLVWNVRLGYEHAGIEFWLNSVKVHAPKAPVFIIGTHVDMVDQFWIPEEELKKNYPQIVRFIYRGKRSGYGRSGEQDIKEELTKVFKGTSYMQEEIPQAWLELEQKIQKHSEEKKTKLVELDEVVKMANASGICDMPEIEEALEFLHELGSIQHFKHASLRNYVVIDTQWIVDALSCIVSVHETPIKDGKLMHSDTKKIWKGYDKNMLNWIMKLTEEFDLTFPLPGEKVNLVPCLLPQEEPKFTWPDVDPENGLREAIMEFSFDHLPAGLFHRTQVRLYQYSEASTMWRYGSLIHKNGHIAVMSLPRDNVIQVKVVGPMPENIMYIIIEVVDILKMESFPGVKYDFQIPCGHCIKECVLEPSLISAENIRRAKECKAPFVQCEKMFHMLTLPDLVSLLPSDSMEDYDKQLGKNIQELQDLRQHMCYDIFVLYGAKDIPNGESQSKVAPRQIYNDLVGKGFKVWFATDPKLTDHERLGVIMKQAKSILVCISNDSLQETHMKKVLNFLTKELIPRRELQIVNMGKDMQWQKHGLLRDNQAIHTSIELGSKDVFSNNFPKLVDSLTDMMKKHDVKSKHTYPDVFISYCVANCGMAGDSQYARGWRDPKDIKNFLEKNTISCYLDEDASGQKGGQFDTIAEGLQHAKLCIVCISNEYVSNQYCIQEFRYAKVTMGIPIIIAVVGSGSSWKRSEIGMLTLEYKNFGFQYRSGAVFDELLGKVKTDLRSSKRTQTIVHESPENIQKSYMELLELSQRKLLRQLRSYVRLSNDPDYPLLIMLDLVKDNDSRSPTPKGHISTKLERPKTGRACYKYVIRFLCEHEEGWHLVPTELPLKPMKRQESEKLLHLVAPFMNRMLALLKFTDLALNILTSEEGRRMRLSLEQKSLGRSNFQDDYIEFRKMVRKLDTKSTNGELISCHMPHGNQLWLCNEHYKTRGEVSKEAQMPFSNASVSGVQSEGKSAPKSPIAKDTGTKVQTHEKSKQPAAKQKEQILGTSEPKQQSAKQNKPKSQEPKQNKNGREDFKEASSDENKVKASKSCIVL